MEETTIKRIEFIELKKMIGEVLDVVKDLKQQIAARDILSHNGQRLFLVNVNVPVAIAAENEQEAMDLAIEQSLIDEMAVLVECGGEFFDRAFQVQQIKSSKDLPENWDKTLSVHNSDLLIGDFILE